MFLLPPDPDTVLRGELGVTKRAAWSAPVPLQDVKTVGRRLGGTVNDVLLTAMTGALRRYMEMRGKSPDGANVHAAVPVDLRPAGAEGELGNQIGFVFLSLPVDMADPEAIIAGLHAEFDALLSLALEAGEPPSVRELFATLEDTLTKLDTILDGEAGIPSPTCAEAPAEPQ